MSYDMLSHIQPKPKKKRSLLLKLNILKLRYRLVLWIIGLTMGTSTFGQFIIEEALQNYGFGVGSFLFASTYKAAPQEALTALNHYRKFHKTCQTIMYLLYVGNPISAIWFQLFMSSNCKKIDYWQRIVTNYYMEKKDSLVVKYEYPFDGGKVILFENIH